MRVYIGATRQNDGKTITCLGLISALKRRLSKIGYIKPVGQRYVEIDGVKIDEDSLLVKTVYELEGNLGDMSPIAIPRHFTENYIDSPNRDHLTSAVTAAFERVKAGKDIVVVEGTGHAGVGSVFDMSNGDVASLLGCKVVIISSGGIGRPIDEIMLNKAMFDNAGVSILGVIVNKVEEAKYDKVKSYVQRGLERKGIELLGVMPYRPLLSSPTVEQLLEDIDGKLVSGHRGLHNTVEKMVIGAMPPHQALDYFSRGTLLITSRYPRGSHPDGHELLPAWVRPQSLCRGYDTYRRHSSPAQHNGAGGEDRDSDHTRGRRHVHRCFADREADSEDQARRL